MHPSNKITKQNIDEIFTYHDDEWKNIHYNDIRLYGKMFALAVLTNTPDCADRAAALRKIREAVATANAAVALASEPWEK